MTSATTTSVPSHGIKGWSQASQAARRPSDDRRAPVTNRRRSSVSSRTAARSSAADPSSGTAASSRRVGRPLTRELLQHAPHFAPLQQQLRLHPAQSAPYGRDGSERTWPITGLGHGLGLGLGLGPELVHVHPLVGEVHEHHEEPPVVHGTGPWLSPVLDDPAADVPGGGQEGLLRAVGPTPDEGAATVLGRPGRGPPHLVADEADVLGAPVVRGREGRVDGRGPGTVRQDLHILPVRLGRSQEPVEYPDAEVQRLHRDPFVDTVEEGLIVEALRELQRCEAVAGDAEPRELLGVRPPDMQYGTTCPSGANSSTAARIRA